MLELFKLALDKDTEAYMNRAIGLAGHNYTSFTQEPPYKFATKTALEYPDPSEKLPDGAYDEKGKLKEEYITKVVKKAYPENHSVWDKLVIDGKMTLKVFSTFLADKHGLRLEKWDFIYGHRTKMDEESKEKMVIGMTASVWPPKVELDYSLIPSLDLTLQQATMAIMKSPKAKPTQKYMQVWREAKAAGIAPTQPPPDENAINDTHTLVEILKKMSKRAEREEAAKTIETRAIPSLEGRQFILIPASDVPTCTDIETDDDIEHLCAFKIML